MNNQNLNLGKYQKSIDARLKKMQEENFAERLWNKDASLWNEEKLQNGISTISLGWLNAVDNMLEALPEVEEFCNSKCMSEFNHIVLLGMGGSSMTPLVFQKTFLSAKKNIKLIVLDTTEPKLIREIEKEINITKTLFIVSSKSGNTVEVMAFYDYFYNQVYKIKEERAGENFIAITDKNSPLAGLAKRKKFQKIFINFPNIGGRYSALSYFGIVPAALMGVDVKEFLQRTQLMIKSCGPQIPLSQNPGIVLGAAIAELALQGCDKLNYLMSPSLSTFGLWLEQLLAESTGKNGKGILPINGTPLSEASTYGKDSFFLSMELSKKNELKSNNSTNYIPNNFPSINITIQDELDLGQEFFRWQIATATAGALLGVNPFDQPNVQESKIYTNEILKKIEQDGKLPEIEVALIEDSVRYYESHKKIELSDDETNGKILLENFFALTKPGDYIALLGYLPEEPEIQKCFLEIQSNLQESLHLPVTTQYGPRYLHSTGQYHKGGPNTGFFIQFICNSTDGIQIPEQAYTFDLLKRAQAIGDMQALIEHGRKVILIDLGKDFINGMNTFKKVIKKIQPLEKPLNKPTLASKNEKKKLELA
ncbi:MAG: transaldolase [Bacteroidota bacterium]